MKSLHFTKEHDLFRQTVREFFENEVKPHAEEWERAQRIPRSIWQKMGELGFLGINFPEKYGGAEADFFYSVVFLEELGRTALAALLYAKLIPEGRMRVTKEGDRADYWLPSFIMNLQKTEPA
jgi:alkylation response protein AidB-like acyl-CoA dehydrogenase